MSSGYSSFKVTAIVSAYFAEQFLESRLQNLREQEVDGIHQIIVVCQSGSLEESIARKWLNGHKFGGNNRFIIVHTEDIPTVYEAWNLGIEQATGEYLTNANSDDILYPDALQTLATALDSNKTYSVSYFDWERVLKHGEAPIGTFRFAEGGLDKLMEGCFLGPGPMWRKSLHAKYGLFDATFKSAGDYEFWLRLAYNGEKFFHIRGNPLGAHLEREDGLEHRSPNLTIWETAKARAKYRKE